ncbi:MAG: ATP-binding cassette domain-containing protein [bacterium]|nr:ATP-binding cassette domain-containing protein [bacterium]
MLEVRQLATSFLGPLDFDVVAGELLCVSGASGSGKSLLLRSLADLDPHTGSIKLDGVEQFDVSPPRWRQQVGLLPAAPAWWDNNVGDCFPPGPVAGTPLTANLTSLGFASADVLDWEIERLSTGESQRLALLRILAMSPRLLLLDEPTANLDEVNTKRLEDLVRCFAAESKAAVIWVSHDPTQQERLGGRCLRLVAGRMAS